MTWDWKESEIAKKAVDTFIKFSTLGFIGVASIMFLEKLLGLTFDISVSLGIP